MPVNKELAYRCQMMKGATLSSRLLAETELLRCGWPQDVLTRDLDGALAWARSQILVAKQEKLRRQRKTKKEKGDEALERMFAAAGVSPEKICGEP